MTSLSNRLTSKILKKTVLVNSEYLMFSNSINIPNLKQRFLSKRNLFNFYFLKSNIFQLKFPIYVSKDINTTSEFLRKIQNISVESENSIFLIKVKFLFFKSLKQFKLFNCLNYNKIYNKLYYILAYVSKLISLKNVI